MYVYMYMDIFMDIYMYMYMYIYICYACICKVCCGPALQDREIGR